MCVLAPHFFTRHPCVPCLLELLLASSSSSSSSSLFQDQSLSPTVLSLHHLSTSALGPPPPSSSLLPGSASVTEHRRPAHGLCTLDSISATVRAIFSLGLTLRVPKESLASVCPPAVGCVRRSGSLDILVTLGPLEVPHYLHGPGTEGPDLEASWHGPQQTPDLSGAPEIIGPW